MRKKTAGIEWLSAMGLASLLAELAPIVKSRLRVACLACSNQVSVARMTLAVVYDSVLPGISLAAVIDVIGHPLIGKYTSAVTP